MKTENNSKNNCGARTPDGFCFDNGEECNVTDKHACKIYWEKVVSHETMFQQEVKEIYFPKPKEIILQGYYLD